MPCTSHFVISRLYNLHRRRRDAEDIVSHTFYMILCFYCFNFDVNDVSKIMHLKHRDVDDIDRVYSLYLMLISTDLIGQSFGRQF